MPDILTRKQRRALPKARLVWVRRRYSKVRSLGRRKFVKFRIANAMFVWVGPLEIGWRMPWLPRSAMALHPQLFTEETVRDA